MYIQDVALPSGIDRNKKRINRIQDYSRRTYIKSSHTGDRQDWNSPDTSQTEAIAGKLSHFSISLFFPKILNLLFTLYS